jgi:hypothetical protein
MSIGELFQVDDGVSIHCDLLSLFLSVWRRLQFVPTERDIIESIE